MNKSAKTITSLRQLVASGLTAGVVLLAAPGAVLADEAAPASAPTSPVQLSLNYKADVFGVASGGLERGTRFSDLLTLAADVDLQRLAGLTGAAAHLEFQNTSGGAPNDLAGSLQGVDNAEVGRRRGRLFQAWVEQSLAKGAASVRLGFSDLNAEFDVADSAGLLIGSAFGISPELAGTGSGGPSVFPSTAVGARLRIGRETGRYGLLAVVNAQAGVPGDPGGADFSFDEGLLTVGEAGWSGRGKLAIGYWRYSRHQDDVREVMGGVPVRRIAQGAYGVIEQPLLADGGPRQVTAFLKVGVSDGRTGDLNGAWQSGLTLKPAFVGRPDSALAFGLAQARLSAGSRRNAADAGVNLGPAETQFELTYSDRLSEHVLIQPDLQYIANPSGDRGVSDAWVTGLRLTVGY